MSTSGSLLFQLQSRKSPEISEVVLDARLCRRVASRPVLYGFGMEGPGLGLGFESCIGNYTSWKTKLIIVMTIS